jgi:hypothetical protein
MDAQAEQDKNFIRRLREKEMRLWVPLGSIFLIHQKEKTSTPEITKGREQEESSREEKKELTRMDRICRMGKERRGFHERIP